MLEPFRAELGDAVVDSHIRPGDDLWVRVAHRRLARRPAEVARDSSAASSSASSRPSTGCRRPFGRSEDAPIDEPLRRRARPLDRSSPAYAGGDTRFQVFARVPAPAPTFGVTSRPTCPTTTSPSTRWIPVYAGADWHEREAQEMFGIDFDGHPTCATSTCPTRVRGPRCARTSRCWPAMVKPWPGIVDVEPMPGEATTTRPRPRPSRGGGDMTAVTDRQKLAYINAQAADGRVNVELETERA